MERLVKVQLQFEFYVELVKPNEDLNKSDLKSVHKKELPDGVADHLERMAKYLNKIIAEFEESSAKFGDQEATELSKLKRLKEFIADFEEGSAFDLKFKTPFHEAIGLIKTAANKKSADENL